MVLMLVGNIALSSVVESYKGRTHAIFAREV